MLLASTLTPLLGAITGGVIILAIAFAAVCLFMMLVILVQKPKGGGLSGAFGGGGGNEGALLGAKVGDFLTYTTVGFFVLFVLLAMGLTWAINPKPAPIEDTLATGLGNAAAVTEEATDGETEGDTGETLTTDEPSAGEAEDAGATDPDAASAETDAPAE